MENVFYIKVADVDGKPAHIAVEPVKKLALWSKCKPLATVVDGHATQVIEGKPFWALNRNLSLNPT